MKTIVFSLLVILCMPVIPVTPLHAQAGDTTGTSITDVPDDSNDLTKAVMRNTVLYGAIPVTFLFGVKVWHWGDNHDFKSEREGWYGQDTSFGGADKAGHLYAHYLMQRVLYMLFDYTENGDPRKWVYSIGTTAVIGSTIEIGDGWSSSYGFSYEDLVMDLAGVAVGALLDYSPVLDGFFSVTVDYVPSASYLHEREEKVPIDFVNDYSGFRYLLNFKFAGFSRIGWKIPAFMRYIQVDLGFYTRDFSAYDADYYDRITPTRNWMVGVSVNMMEVVSDFFEDKKSVSHRVATTPFMFYHVPAGYRYSSRID